MKMIRRNENQSPIDFFLRGPPLQLMRRFSESDRNCIYFQIKIAILNEDDRPYL
jgi:hypothetical protein